MRAMDIRSRRVEKNNDKYYDLFDDELLSSIPQIDVRDGAVDKPLKTSKSQFALEPDLSTRSCSRSRKIGDAWICDKEAGIYAILDGINAKGFAHLASRRASQSMLYWIRATRKRDGLIPFGSGDHKREAQRLRMAFAKAHEEIKALGGKISSDVVSAFGCSAVAALLTESNLVVGWLGNSRLYRLREGLLKQITVDHTLASLQVIFGLISEMDAEKSPVGQNANYYLGARGAVDIRIKELGLEDGDRYLLCTSSVIRSLDEKRIRTVLNDPVSPKIASEWLVRSAANVDPGDDMTAMVIDVRKS